MFKVAALAGCCGITVIFDLERFDGQDLRRLIYGRTAGEIAESNNGDAEFNEPESEEGYGSDEFFADTNGDLATNIYLATTIASQTKAIAAFEEFGFHAVATIPSANSGNLITTWMFDKTEYKECPVLPPPNEYKPDIPAVKKGQKPITPLAGAGRTSKRATAGAKKRKTAKRS